MNKVIIAAIAALALAAAVYTLKFSPSVKMRALTERSLQQFSDAVATKDRAKIQSAMNALIDDKAAIALNIETVTIGQQIPPIKLDLDKQGFAGFVDGLLGRVSDYAYEVKLEEFNLAADKQSASVKLSSHEWGDGMGEYGATSIAVRFSSSSLCEGKVNFESATAKLSGANCNIIFRSVPKAGELGKVKEDLEQKIKEINR